MAFAPIIIDTPEVPPRDRATALTSYLPLDVGTNTTPRNVNRWMNGVTFVPLGCDADDLIGRSFDPCVQHDFPAARAFEDAVTFLPFEGDVAISCSPLSLPIADLKEHLDMLVERAASRLFGIQVMDGTYRPANPSLRTEATDISYSAGIDTPINALSAIEDALADKLQGGMGMIHMTPGVFTQLVDILTLQGGRWYTATGHIVVADAGYRGPTPDGAVVAGQSFMYGSSPVRFKFATPNLHGAWWENFNFSKDIQTIRISVIGLAVFEPCSAVAALVDWSPA